MAKVLRWPGGQQPKEVEAPRGFWGLLRGFFTPSVKETHPKGLAGEWKVARALADSLGDRWTIINDLNLKGATGKSQVDHLLLGPWGIYCIETKNWNTAACDEQGQWLRYQNNLWVPQKSPTEQLLKKLVILQDLLQEGDVVVQGILVFASPGKFDFSQAVLPPGIKVMGLPGLLQYLNLQEKEVDRYSKEQLVNLIRVIQK